MDLAFAINPIGDAIGRGGLHDRPFDAQRLGHVLVLGDIIAVRLILRIAKSGWRTVAHYPHRRSDNHKVRRRITVHFDPDGNASTCTISEEKKAKRSTDAIYAFDSVGTTITAQLMQNIAKAASTGAGGGNSAAIEGKLPRHPGPHEIGIATRHNDYRVAA
jgi:hypothetical protein